MNDRQRFNATMHYQSRDRAPICDFGFWPETIEEWHKQGLPSWVTYENYNSRFTNQYFGMDVYHKGWTANAGLCPGFEEIVLEDRGDCELVQQWDGVRVLRQKYMGSIPMHEGHLLEDRESWEKHYKWRFDPSTPERYPNNWDEAAQTWRDPGRDYPLALEGGSLYGRLRDFMGLENISLVPYDDPAWFEEMVETVTVCVEETLKRVLATGGKFDACQMWEDMCYNSGPLLSPPLFKKYLVPRYKRITDLLHKHGVDVVWLDCDGKIDDLLPMWLEAGVNCMFPLEIGTWGADPVKYRHEYGRDLLMMGGFDKHILARGKSEIESEVRRLAPIVEEGGFIPFCDHRVPPDVSLENYLFYLDCARKIWGYEVNLQPVEWRVENQRVLA